MGSGGVNSYKEKSIYLITSTILENDKLKYVVLKVKHIILPYNAMILEKWENRSYQKLIYKCS